MRPIRAALVAAVTVAAVLATPGAAVAKAETVKDSTGDVYEYFYDPATEEGSYVLVGEVDNADLKKTTLKHTDKRVEVTGVFTDLTRGGFPNLALDLQLPGGEYGAIGVYVHDGDLYPYAFGAHSRGGQKCQGKKASISYKKDRLTVSAPRQCIDSPKWVKFHAHVYGYEYVSEEEDHTYSDNGHNDQANWNGWSGKVKKG